MFYALRHGRFSVNGSLLYPSRALDLAEALDRLLGRGGSLLRWIYLMIVNLG